MFCHWNYVLEGLLGRVQSRHRQDRHAHPDPLGRARPAIPGHRRRRGLRHLRARAAAIIAQINSSWAVRVYRDELVEFQIDGTHGSAVAGLHKCVAQQRAHTPKPVWNPDLPVTESFRDQWLEVPANADLDNGFKIQWEEFLARRGRRPAAPLRPAVGRPRRAARRARPAVVGRGPPPRDPGDHAVTAARATMVDLPTVRLPSAGGALEQYVLHGSGPVDPAATADHQPAGLRRRPRGADGVGGQHARRARPPSTGTTLAFRHELWSYGLGVADAMDTAQRGMGLDWAATRELIPRSGRGGRRRRRRCSPAAPAPTSWTSLTCRRAGRASTAIIDAYREQIAVVTRRGRHGDPDGLPGAGRGGRHRRRGLPARLRARCSTRWTSRSSCTGSATCSTRRWPGYWGSADIPAATGFSPICCTPHAEKIDGVKVSLLDADHEIALRAGLPAGVRLYTGDDFNYPELIVGDGTHHSDALLGIFAAIYPAASTALQALDAGDDARARAILDSTQALARHIFAAPTRYYKTGIAFLSWLNGHQPGFAMVGGLCSPAGPWRTWSQRSGWPTGPGCSPTRSWPHTGSALLRATAGRRHDATAQDRPIRRRCTAVAEHRDHQELDAARGGRRRRPGRAPGARPVARPGGRSRHRARRARWSATPGCGCRRCAAAASSPPPTRPRQRRRWTTTARPSTRPPTSAPALIMVVGGLPAGDRDLAGARQRVGRPDRRPGAVRQASTASGSRSSRCTRCTAPTGR